MGAAAKAAPLLFGTGGHAVRKVTWFTLGFGTACAFCAYVLIPGFLHMPFFALSLMLLLLPCDRKWLKAVSMVCMGISVGIFWFVRYDNHVLDPLRELDGVSRESVIRCTDFAEVTDYGIRVAGRTEIGGRSYAVLAYLNGEDAVEPGTVLSGAFRFQVTAPGGQKASSYYQSEGIYLLAYQKDELTVTRDNNSWQDLPAVLRKKVTEILDVSLPSDTSAFAKALMLGNSGDLDYETLTAFSVSGIRHIVAVSGLHVSVLFGLLGFLTLRKRFLSALVAMPALFLFAAVTGFTPSVSRACIMSALVILASLVNREYDGPTSLSLAGLILLLRNPLVITSVSYQLSFCSVAGIFAFAPGIRKWLRTILERKKAGRFYRNLVNGLSLSVSVTLGATAATLPLCAMYFGVISIVAVVTNLLVLWAVSIIFYGLMAVCLLGCFWASAGAAVGGLISILIRYVLTIAKLAADFPLAAVYTRSTYIVLWLIYVYILLILFLLSDQRKPQLLCCCVTLSLCTLLLLSWAEPMVDDVRFTVLDVGQGQSLLLQTEEKTFLVDCGGSSDTGAADAAAEALLSQGISQLDGLILTHYDRDHSGGAENLLTRIDTGLLVLPPVYTDLRLDADEVLYAYEDLTLTVGDAEIHIYSSGITEDSNENSLCILFDTQECDILITGDRDGFGERMLLRGRNIPDVDVLVAGHHGSRQSVCEELLAAVQPEIVCISVGADNSFGHPAPEVLQRLEQFGCRVYRTDLHGDIVIRR